MKLTKITLRDFRAFPTGKDNYEFTLPNGENLLLYGENGSGKTSLYHALRAIFAPRAAPRISTTSTTPISATSSRRPTTIPPPTAM